MRTVAEFCISAGVGLTECRAPPIFTETSTKDAPAIIQAGPVAPDERIQLIDILRGFALFSILLVNLELFSHPVQQLALGHGDLTALADRLTVWGIQLFANSKFYPIFSFLFGLGFALQIQRAEARGSRFVPIYLRRLLILLLIGLVHAIFFWVGDILVLYAVLGTILLLFRRRSPRTLLVWAAIMLAAPVLLFGALSGLILLAQLSPDGAAEIAKEFAESEAGLRTAAAQASHIYATGSFGEITAQRISDLGFTYSFAIFLALNAFAMFLLGLYAGRRGIFQEIPAHRALFRRILWWGLAFGVSSQLAYVALSEGASQFEPTLGSFVANVLHSIGWAGAGA